MTVPVLIDATDGQFSAWLAGAPELRCVGPSKAEAIEALQAKLAQKIQAGELVDVDLSVLGVSGVAGRFKGDAALREIREQIYRDRDADQQQ